MGLLFGKKKDPPPRVYTECTCGNCGEKIQRSFEDGDFVFMALATACANCSSRSLRITGIYGVYPEKPEDY